MLFDFIIRVLLVSIIPIVSCQYQENTQGEILKRQGSEI